MKKYWFIIALLFCCGLGSRVNAQWLPYYPGTLYRLDQPDTLVDADQYNVSMPKLEPHLSVGTGFMGTNYGDNRAFTSVAPSLVYRPNQRWTLIGGMRITQDMGLNPNYTPLGADVNYAPYKRNGGTGLISVGAAAIYQVNDNVWLGGSIYHIGGTYAPLYWGNGQVFDVSCTAVSAEAAFRFANDHLLQISFTYIHDNTGAMPYMMHDAWMHYGGWGLYGHPYGCYHMPMGFCY